MWSCVRDPWSSLDPVSSVRIQASPARLKILSKAASDLHVVTSADMVGSSCRWCRWSDGGILFPVVCVCPCAELHSLADLILLIAISTDVKVRFSKIAAFLAVHNAQHIHSSILFGTPVGGRQIACLKATTTSLKLAPVARWTTCLSGIRFYTSFANGQSKKVCTTDSTLLHL